VKLRRSGLYQLLRLRPVGRASIFLVHQWDRASPQSELVSRALGGAQVLQVVGPLVAAVGGFVLIIDVLEGPARWYDPTPLRETYAFIRDHRIEVANEHLSYSPERIAEEVRRAKKEYEENMSELDRRVAADTLRDKFRARARAGIGFLLLVIGSVMQAVGAALY